MEKNLPALPQHHTNSRKTAPAINTLSCREYLIWNMVFVSLYYLSFMYGRFTPIIESHAELSAFLLIVAASFWFGAGLAMTLENRRTFSSVAGNTLPPAIVYCMINKSYPFHTLWLWIFVICAMLTLVFSLQKIWGYIRNGVKHKTSHLIFYYFITSRNAIACVFVLVILVCNICPAASNFFASKETSDQTAACYSMEDCADELEVFRDNVWSDATEEEKLQGLQAAANIDSTDLGLAFTPTVDIKPLEKCTIACYNHKARTIHFNSTHFNENTNLTALNTVLHECYHALQRSMLDVYDTLTEEQKKLSTFRHLEKYKTELAYYEDGEDDYSAYLNQQIEIDARQYAKRAIVSYLSFLSKKKSQQ